MQCFEKSKTENLLWAVLKENFDSLEKEKYLNHRWLPGNMYAQYEEQDVRIPEIKKTNDINSQSVKN